MAKDFLARIKPSSKRETQVVLGYCFRKAKGWHGPLPEALATALSLHFARGWQERVSHDNWRPLVA